MEVRSGLTDLVCALKHALSVAIPGSILTFTTDGDAKDYADGYDFAALSECLDFMVSVARYSRPTFSHLTSTSMFSETCSLIPTLLLLTDANDLQFLHEG